MTKVPIVASLIAAAILAQPAIGVSGFDVTTLASGLTSVARLR